MAPRPRIVRGERSRGIDLGTTLGISEIGGGLMDTTRRLLTETRRPAAHISLTATTVTADWSTTDVSVSTPTIEEDVNASGLLTGTWQLNATAKLAADDMTVPSGELTVHINGIGNSRPGPFLGSGLIATSHAGMTTTADAMFVGARFASGVYLPDAASGVELTLTITGYRVGD